MIDHKNLQLTWNESAGVIGKAYNPNQPVRQNTYRTTPKPDDNKNNNTGIPMWKVVALLFGLSALFAMFR